MCERPTLVGEPLCPHSDNVAVLGDFHRDLTAKVGRGERNRNAHSAHRALNLQAGAVERRPQALQVRVGRNEVTTNLPRHGGVLKAALLDADVGPVCGKPLLCAPLALVCCPQVNVERDHPESAAIGDARGNHSRCDLSKPGRVRTDRRLVILRMLQALRNGVEQTELDAGLADFGVGSGRRGAVRRHAEDRVRLQLDQVLEVADLLLRAPSGIRDSDDLDSGLLECRLHAGDKNLREVDVHGLHGDADPELRRLDLGKVLGRELDVLFRARLLAVGAEPHQRLGHERHRV